MARGGFGVRPLPWVAALLLAAWSSPASAQPAARFSVDSVISVDEFQGENASDRPNIVIDISATVRLGDRWQIYVRPLVRQPRAPTWDKLIYQAALRYEHAGAAGGVDLRIDAGYIASPVGLGMFDTRASVNPTIAPHFTYVTPLPTLDPARPRAQAVAATYPLGAQMTLSTDRWDARAAVVNSAPTRIHTINGAANPRQTPVFEAGAGVTPKQGLRFGVSLAQGAYATNDEPPRTSPGNRSLTLVGVEAEYAFGYTRISGELLRDRFETTSAAAIAYAWFVQGVHTLSPRWFVAAREEGARAGTAFNAIEATAGFRATREITLRGSYLTRHAYGGTTWDHQAGVSVVWARRWR